MPTNIPLTTKGDVAAAGMGFAGGFAVDAWLLTMGIPPGTFASLSAVGCVSAKNAVQGAWDTWLGREKQKSEREEQEHERKKQRARLNRKAEACSERLQRTFHYYDQTLGQGERRREHNWGRLQRDRSDWGNGILSDDEFEQTLDEIEQTLDEIENEMDRHEQLHQKANAFLDKLNEEGEEGLAGYVDRLQHERDLWERNILSDDEFEQTLTEIISSYRRGEPLTPGDQKAR